MLNVSQGGHLTKYLEIVSAAPPSQNTVQTAEIYFPKNKSLFSIRDRHNVA